MVYIMAKHALPTLSASLRLSILCWSSDHPLRQ